MSNSNLLNIYFLTKSNIGAKWIIDIRELSSINYSITFEVIDCQPESLVASAIHTITLKKITSTNGTFIEWVSDFSSDATTEVVMDSTFKRREAFTDLEKAASSMV